MLFSSQIRTSPGVKRSSAFTPLISCRRSSNWRSQKHVRPAALSQEARISHLENTQKDHAKDLIELKLAARVGREAVKSLRSTDNALLQVVEKRGRFYENRFESQLKRFEDSLKHNLDAALSPLKSEMTAMTAAQKSDMATVTAAQNALQTDSTTFKAIGRILVTVFTIGVGLYEPVLSKIRGWGPVIATVSLLAFAAFFVWDYFKMKRDMQRLLQERSSYPQTSSTAPNVVQPPTSGTNASAVSI